MRVEDYVEGICVEEIVSFLGVLSISLLLESCFSKPLKTEFVLEKAL